MTPRKPQGLPFVRRTKSGGWEYCRRVPVELRRHFGNRSYFAKVIAKAGVNQQDPAFIKRWTEINADMEAQIAAAKAEEGADSTDALAPIPLSPRNAAGIGAEPWRQLLNVAETGDISTNLQQRVADTLVLTVKALLEAQQAGDSRANLLAQQQMADIWLAPVLKDLGIEPTPQAMEQIRRRFSGYLPMAAADKARMDEGDFSPGDLQVKAPPLPQKKVTYEELLDAWRLNSGGTREIDGMGAGQKRTKEYQTTIKELTEITGKFFPDELTIEDARGYVQHIQTSSLSPSTKMRRVSNVRFLFQIGLKYGYLDQNVFRDMKISIPKGGEAEGYRPFSKPELQKIFRELKVIEDNQRTWIPLLLLCTGARLSEMLLLRHGDIKKTLNGIYYFDLVHQPTGEYPHPLKQGKANERQVPLHPLLIEQKFLTVVDSNAEGYLFPGEKNDLLSQWFRILLKRIDIYEARTTALHSLRGTWIDLMREARVDEDVRRAFVGHSSGTSHDRNYGFNLRQSPEILHKEMVKVNLDWLF